MKVIEKTVKRYFLNGKGYATRKAAHLAIARKELKDRAYKILRSMKFDGENDEERFAAYLKAYATLFPLHEEPMSYHMTKKHYYGYCVTCKKEWLNQRANDLMKEVENGC